MVCQSRFHRWSHAQRLMYPAKVIPAHIQRNRVLEIFQLATVCIAQTGKPSELASNSQIAPLYMGSRNITGIRSSVFDAWDSSDYSACGTVPLRAIDVMARKQFDEHGIIRTSSEVFLNRRNIPAQSVGCKLKTSINSFSATRN